MKPSSGTLALISLALCLPVYAQDAATHTQLTAAPSASVAAASTNTVGLSDIRIVRLSQVRGKVDIDRHIGRGSEEAFVNIPITGGTRLHTDIGVAEVEFEDNSTLRLTPDTDVEFTLLKRTATGSTISAVNVLHGMIYANLAGTKGNTFTITAGKSSVAMNPSSHIRFTVDGLNSNISVLDGSVEFTDPFAYTSTLTHKKSLDFDVTGSKQPEFAKLETSPFDEWDKNGNDYQKLYASQRLSGGTGMLYGTGDLNYYGSFSNFGCGSMWRPYFASAAWSPYDNGMWAYYPSVGYSWVSPYPWGWMPFHSGNWVNCGAAGWGWQPGASFVGLQNVAAAGAGVGTPTGGRMIPTAPVAPRPGAPAMVPVNTRPLAVSSVSAPGTFTFRKDSAGLGVPRETFGELKSISSDVSHHGQVNTEVERSVIGPSPAFRNANTNNGNLNNRGTSGREVSPGSRSVATFSRPGADAHGNGEMNAGWSGMQRGSEASSPSSMSRPSVGMAPRPESAPASPRGGGSSPQASAGASHK